MPSKGDRLPRNWQDGPFLVDLQEGDYMAAQEFPRIVERRLDDWSFKIGATHLPEYVIVTGVGSPGPNVFFQSVSDVITVMDAFLGASSPFCPMVFIASEARPARLTVSTVMRAFPSVIRRLDRVYVVTDRDHEQPDFMMLFIKGMMSLHRGIKTVSSLEQALEELRRE
jgi:hypothetical protein